MDKNELQVTAQLAMLALEDEERVANAVSEMLGHFEKMTAVDIEGLAPTTHVLVRENRVREDAPKPTPNPERLQKDAPSGEDGFYVIPKVL